MGKLNANSGGGDFVPAPAGMHSAVCVDMEDLGYVKQNYNGDEKLVPQIKYVFQIAERMENGRPFTIAAWFTASLHEKAKLRATLESWLGRPINEGEEVDPETMIGKAALLQIMQEPNREGKIRANIKAVLPLMAGMEPLLPEDFIRKCHRADYEAPLTSAFDERAVAERKIAEANGQQALPPYLATPAYPHNEYGGTNAVATPVPAAPVAPAAAAPMTTGEMTKLLALATSVHGANAVAELEKLSQQLFGKSWAVGSSDEASRLMHEMRQVPASQSVAAKVEAATGAGSTPGASAIEMSAPYSPFADEGTPGYRPDGHPDIEADEQQSAFSSQPSVPVASAQPSLVASAPAYPAN